MNIENVIKDRILVLDGAMGTMIQSYSLEEHDFRGNRFINVPGIMKGNNDMLNITRPDVISDIHKRYLEAGADIITTNTFNSQIVSQADYHLQDYAVEMAYEGARIARAIADKYSTKQKPRFVVGSVGPTNKTCSISPDADNPAARNITYDELVEAYSQQIGALLKGGVDAILIETIFDTLNAKAAICAAMNIMEQTAKPLPIMLSVTVNDLAGRTLSGQSLDAFLASISTFPIFSVGLNCSFGAKQMKPYVRDLARHSSHYISVYPNAGIPDSFGHYDDSPETMALEISELVNDGVVNIVGGCCGTTDEYIAKLVSVVEGKKPHLPCPICQNLQLSGLDKLELTSEVKFINVGERCNVSGSRKFLRLIKEKKYEEALGIARKQVADGALVIDVNMDDALLDAPVEMTTFLNLIATEPDIAKVPVMIDSSNWDVIRAGLKCVQGKSIVNSISLKDGEDKFICRANEIKKYGAAVIVMCFDEQGQATDYNRKIEIAARAYHLLVDKVKMSPSDIIFDPNVLTIGTGMSEHDNYAVDFIKATRWIRENLPESHVCGGISNLSFSFRGNNYIREAMHAVFLYHAIDNGLDLGILNPATNVTYSDILPEHITVLEDVVLNRCEGAADKLIKLAEALSEVNVVRPYTCGHEKETLIPEWRSGDVRSRLVYAMTKGVSDFLEEDLNEAMGIYGKAINIIEGPLLEGMNVVGELFASGKMFLPQVIKTARTMKKAVSVLRPYIEMNSSGQTKKSGTVLLATVKGDVHDIGKNIVSLVLTCNNYDVVDLGVMVPAEQIAQKAMEENVDAIGLSGLITPSLEEMQNVVNELNKYDIKIPLMIGGAATNELYVAIKISPIYKGPVIWVHDASQNPVYVSNFLNEEKREAFIKSIDDKYMKMRTDYDGHNKRVNMTIDDARKNRLSLFE